MTVFEKRSCHINWEADKSKIKLGSDKIKDFPNALEKLAESSNCFIIIILTNIY